MEILYLMVPLGLVLVGFGLWAFFWAVGSGQFDDLDSPGWSVLDDDKQRKSPGAAAPTDTDPASSPTRDGEPK
jgi:cbb3-type cytochrome oxidase maturation protein